MLLRLVLFAGVALLVAIGGLAVFVDTIGERVDHCLCGDGSRREAWMNGWVTPASHCASLCQEHRGGRPLTDDEVGQVRKR